MSAAPTAAHVSVELIEAAQAGHPAQQLRHTVHVEGVGLHDVEGVRRSRSSS